MKNTSWEVNWDTVCLDVGDKKWIGGNLERLGIYTAVDYFKQIKSTKNGFK